MSSGSWSAVLPWPLIGIHPALLPDGRVLTFGSDENGEQGPHKIYDIWDPKTGLHLTTTDAIATDEFCCAEDPRPDHRQYDYHWWRWPPSGSRQLRVSSTSIRSTIVAAP